jgi:outer membrane biosynthesis protein TonB
MPILELFPNPSRDPDQTQETAGDAATDPAIGRVSQPLKLRTSRYGTLEEHEIIHLLDSLDDERSRARFRESIYISIIIYLALAWFLFYGPRVLFHQPQYQDPIALMKQHDKELTFLTQHSAPALKPPPPPVIDRKTMQQLEQQARLTALTPQPPAQQPQEEARTTAPPVPQPAAPLPSAPKPAQPSVESPLPAAPHPNFAQNNQSARSAIQDAMRGALSGRGGADYGPSSGSRGPLQAGASILSDTMGVDFSAYMRRLHDDIQRNWDPLIPEEVQPPLLKRGIVGIRFTILPDGKIGAITLETRSGDVALDHAAWNAITSEGQFQPLPRQFHGPQLELRVGFFYNIPLPE